METRENDFFFRSGGRRTRGSGGGGGGGGRSSCIGIICDNCLMLSSVSSYASSWLMWMDAVMGPVLGSDTSVFRRSANDGAAGGRAGIIGTSAASGMGKLGKSTVKGSICKLTRHRTSHRVSCRWSACSVEALALNNVVDFFL